MICRSIFLIFIWHEKFWIILLAHNGFGLCVRAGFRAQSFKLLLKFIRSTKLQVCTSPRLTQNPCYTPFFYSSFVFTNRFFIIFHSFDRLSKANLMSGWYPFVPPQPTVISAFLKRIPL